MKNAPRMSAYRSYVKLVSLLIALNIAVISASSYAITRAARSAVYASEYAGNSAMIKQLCVAIDSRFEVYNRIAQHVSQDSSAQGYLSRDMWSLGNMRVVADQVQTWLRLTMNVSRVEFWLDYAELPDFYSSSYDYASSLDGGTSLVMYYNLDSVSARFGADYARTLSAVGQWRQIDRDGEFGCISWHEPLWDYDALLSGARSGAQIGYMRIIVKLSDVVSGSLLVDGYEHTGVFLVSASGRELYSFTGRKMSEFDDADLFLRYTHEIQNTDMKVVAFTSSEVLANVYKSISRASLLLLLVMVLSCLTVGFLLARRIYCRVVDFQRRIGEYRLGDIITIERRGKPDEFAAAEDALCDMSATIARLIGERDEANARKTRAELEMLQAQINPHFLYNTLSSISTLAQLGRYSEMNGMMTSLTEFYRISLSKGDLFIPVERELAHAGYYVRIREMQFGDGVSVEISNDAAALKCLTLKALIQPFIENVYIHAVRDDARVRVEINASIEGDALVFTIADDGRGANDDALARMTSEHGCGYGVFNVHRRLQVQFGEDYGVTVAARAGGGFIATLRQPRMPLRDSN